MNWNELNANSIALISDANRINVDQDSYQLDAQQILNDLAEKMHLNAKKGRYDVLCVFPLKAVNDETMRYVQVECESKGFTLEASTYLNRKIILRSFWKSAAGLN